MARKKALPPSLDYIEALKTELQALYADQDTQIDRLRELRTLTRRVPLPDEYRIVDVEVRDSTIADEIQRVAAMLSVNPPKLQVIPARPGDTAQRNATLRERWTEEVLRVAGSRPGTVPTFTALVDAVVGDGGGWTKLLFTPDTWDARYSLKLPDFGTEDEETALRAFTQAVEEEKKRAGPPFVWVHVDVRTVYPVWSGGRLTEVLEVQERPLLSTFRQYRLGLAKNGEIVSEELGQPLNEVVGRVGRTVTFLEHWDETWVTYAVLVPGGGKGAIVKQWQHGYGRVPYFFAPGLWANWWRNRKVGWSISETKRWLVEYLAYLMTVHAQIAARDALTPLFRELPDTAAPLLGSDGRPVERETWRPGEIIIGRPGEKLGAIQFPQVAAVLREEIAMVREAIERLATPRVRAEIGGGLEGAGFAINQVLAEAKTRFDPLAQSVERHLEEVTRFLWHLVRTKVRETVWVYATGERSGWLGLGPEDLEENVAFRWHLDPERPTAKIIEARYWHERLQAGTASLDQAIEAMGDNPDEVRIQKTVEKLRQSPWYQQLLEQMVLQEIGRGDLLQKAQEAQQVAQTGQLPGVPPAMGNELVPDMAAQAMAPGGAGAVPVRPNPGGIGPGAVVPQQAAAAGIQELGG